MEGPLSSFVSYRLVMEGKSRQMQGLCTYLAFGENGGSLILSSGIHRGRCISDIPKVSRYDIITLPVSESSGKPSTICRSRTNCKWKKTLHLMRTVSNTQFATCNARHQLFLALHLLWNFQQDRLPHGKFSTILGLKSRTLNNKPVLTLPWLELSRPWIPVVSSHRLILPGTQTRKVRRLVATPRVCD